MGCSWPNVAVECMAAVARPHLHLTDFWDQSDMLKARCLDSEYGQVSGHVLEDIRHWDWAGICIFCVFFLLAVALPSMAA